jgi:hypothetical protein
MKKRFKFRCWNPDCGRDYTLFREINDDQKVIVSCPYCLVEGIVELGPYKREMIPVLRGRDTEGQPLGYEFIFPDILPTKKP